ncbi:response regulator [Nocardia sp. XZ_19_385]|uniref:response regulator n=1 Tax=Nocardia sp. XZ_19_385 TaxID=2769488 RepID=UPI00188E7488|nr:response regulator [Nocardia sp. XZ_19_385]
MNIFPPTPDRYRRPLIPPDAEQRHGRVLVLEVDPAVAEITTLVLESAGHDPVHAAHSADALALTGDWKPDIVLADPAVPGIFELPEHDRLRGDGPIPPLIVMSTQPDPDIVALAISAGAHDFLIKPFRTLELLTVIQTALLGLSHGSAAPHWSTRLPASAQRRLAEQPTYR